MDVKYTNLRWCNKAFLGFVGLTLVVMAGHIVGAIVDNASKPPGCWECPFPAVAHGISAWYAVMAVFFWGPFVFWAGAWRTPTYARMLAAVQLIVVVIAGVLVTLLTAGTPLLPWWGVTLNAVWFAGGAAHALAVLLVPSRHW